MVGAAVACGGFTLGGPAAFWSALIGLMIAPAAGVVALPGEVLPPRSRSTGFGLFYVLSFAGMGLVPVVGGLLVSQFITLYLTPVVYTYMAALFRTRPIEPALKSEAAAV